MTPPPRARVDHVDEQVEVREAGGVLDPPALHQPVAEQRDGDQHQPPQNEWAREVHRGLLFRAKNEANGRSQSPAVERTRCGIPSEASSRSSATRSSAAATAKRSRSRRRAVSTCVLRPVSGSTSQTCPTFGSSCSRGSRISTATTAWREASRSNGARQSRGPRKSETTTASERSLATRAS